MELNKINGEFMNEDGLLRDTEMGVDYINSNLYKDFVVCEYRDVSGNFRS